MLVSTARITTENPQRLITRLCKHWGHKFPASYDDHQGEIELSLGHCLLEAHENGLQVRLQAAVEEQIQRLQQVVADHLERMAAGETFVFNWQS
ncbi:cytochrome B [Stutzerimonas xanthomarina]|nr:cytochrome B [Stutzerimonas xanthomarina]